MNVSDCKLAGERVVRSNIACMAALRASAEDIAELRRQPILVGGEKLPASLLKQADDQTVLATHAVLSAAENAGWSGRSYADWGVIASGNLFGRSSVAQAVIRYREEGAWGISPNLIPHSSLHAMSGTISLALKIHGPNFGVGGGPNGVPDAFLLAATMLMDGSLPGLWLALTAYESEWLPETKAPVCEAIALALTPLTADHLGLRLSIGATAPSAAIDHPARPLLVGDLAELCTAPNESTDSRWELASTSWLEVERGHP